MSEWINADDAIPLAPGVSPAVQPLADTRGETGTGGTASDVLSASVFLFTDNSESYI